MRICFLHGAAAVRGSVTPALLERFARAGIHSGLHGQARWRVGDPLLVNPYAKIEPYSHFFQGQVMPRAFGAFSYTHSAFDLATSVGRYCSISVDVQLMGMPHPMAWATTSPYSYTPHVLAGFDDYFRDHDLAQPQPLAFDEGERWVKIGNDVWVGAQSLLKRMVTIGDGAVIGARAVVTRDVPPYAIVAGVPARVLRYRFPEPLVERYLRVQPWRYGPDLLHTLGPEAPDAFLDRLEEAIARGAEPLDLPAITGREILELAT